MEEDVKKKILESFREYCESDPGKAHYAKVLNEEKDLKQFFEKLKGMDRNSVEFVENILYGFLPNHYSKLSKRTSLYPYLRNIRQFFSRCGMSYNDADWKNVADLVFNSALEFERDPTHINEIVIKFSDSKYSKRLQSGSMTPIFYCLNSNYPIINNLVRETFEYIMAILGHKDHISQRLVNYPESIKKLERMVNLLGEEKLRDNHLLNLFCFWFEVYFMKTLGRTEKEDEPTEEEEIIHHSIEKVNIHSFLSSITPDDRTYGLHTLPAPERLKIRDIISNVESRWALPYFQRYFTWKKSDIRDLLQSVFDDYYVGSILLWGNQGVPNLEIISIDGVQHHILEPDCIILDGQQRITSLYYAIKAPEVKSTKLKRRAYFYINFKKFFESGNDGEFIEVTPTKFTKEECFERILFPFTELENHRQWINDFDKYLYKLDPGSIDKIRSVRQIMEKHISHIWDGFEIPFVKLPKTMSLAQVTKIFELLNSKGEPLSVFDLLIAKLYVNKINLRDLWEGSKKEHPSLKRYAEDKTERMPILILQSMALTFSINHSCKREDLLDIYEKVYDGREDFTFKDHWKEMSQFTAKALDMMEGVRNYGALNERFLPFTSMIPLLSALLREAESRKGKAEYYRKIDIWYWASVFSNAYSSSVDSKLTSDYKEMKLWFDDDIKLPMCIIKAHQNIALLDLRQVAYSGDAVFKGVLCLLVLNGAKDFNTGRVVESVKSNDKDHIFPKGESAGFSTYHQVKSIANITWNSKETNRAIKSAKRPSVYIHEFLNDKPPKTEDEIKAIFKTHFINDVAYSFIKKDMVVEFIDERNNEILQEIRKRAGYVERTLSSEINPLTPLDNKRIYAGKIGECHGTIKWVDKYFTKAGLDILADSINAKIVTSIKILMAVEKADEKFRDSFKDFKEQVGHRGVNAEIHVIADNHLKSQIHDRWIIADNIKLSIPSPDVMERGQHSEIHESNTTFDFDGYWDKCPDIIQDWNTIKNARDNIPKK